MTSALWKHESPVGFPTRTAESTGLQEPITFVDSMDAETEEEVVQMVDCVNMASTTRAIILAGGEQKNPLTQYPRDAGGADRVVHDAD